jgi:hypothetical protein
MGVSVGNAACVSAIMALAAALAVAITSGVGVAFAPHALNMNARTVTIIRVSFMVLFFSFLFSAE